ncbi:hypothetical protein [Halobaculum sp. EA56]|uniref:hypothetical protein n=1 Tax=Halobaculum sp. EA56 TaxID=3421648 RepID=UPI003EC07392
MNRAEVDRLVDAYREEEPLYPVEREAIETLPEAFRTGAYGRRDAEWVVQWYFRRYLGAYPDEQRRTVESRFGDADTGAVRDAIATAGDATDHAGALSALTVLPGVDPRVGSAFLFFLDPGAYLVVGDREWRVVDDLVGLGGGSPEPFGLDDYGRYLDAARTLASRYDLDNWRLYMALWRRWKEMHGDADGVDEGDDPDR